MPKPIVVITGSKAREELRACGVIRPSCFYDIGSGQESLSASESADGARPRFGLWSSDIDYATAGSDLHVESQQAEISRFWGLAADGDDLDALQANEEKVVGLLRSVMVHVLFLGSEKSEYGGQGYSQFSTFDELTGWVTRLEKVLPIRYQGEHWLKDVANVCVIVSRSSNVQADNEQLRKFSVHVGPDKVFRSCYFLNYNLAIARGEMQFSSNVWSVMVGRLLLAFFLSGEQKDACPVWDDGGSGGRIKIWRAFDCSVAGEDLAERRIVSEKIKNAYDEVSRAVLRKSSDNPDSVAKEIVDKIDEIENSFSSEGLFEEVKPDRFERKLNAGNWSDFDARNLADEVSVENAARWEASLKSVVAKVRGRKETYSEPFGKRSFSILWDRIHRRSGNIFRAIDEIEQKESECVRNHCLTGAEAPDEIVRKVATLKKEREDLYLQIVGKPDADRDDKDRESCLESLERAQRCYLGAGIASLLVCSMTLAFGFVAGQVMRAFFPINLALVHSVFLALAFAVGSAFAAWLLLSRHRRAGYEGTKAFVKLCEEVDRKMQQQHECSQKMLFNSYVVHSRMRYRANVGRVLRLMKRVREILVREFQTDTSEVAVSGNVNRTREGKRMAFYEMTHGFLNVQKAKEGVSEELQRTYDEWWRDNGRGGNMFLELWRVICAKDSENTGFIPASLLVRRSRRFLTEFSDTVRTVHSKSSFAENGKEILDKVLLWARDVFGMDDFKYYSAACKDLDHAVKSIYVRKPLTSGASSCQEVLSRTRDVANDHHAKCVESAFMSETSHIAFAYQEAPVELFSGEEGILSVRKVGSDVLERGEG